MTSDEMKRAIDLLTEYAQTGMLCISEEDRKILCCFARAMGEWGK